MADNNFVTWFDENKDFLDESGAAVYWDTVVTNSHLQQSIAKSKKARALYSHIEAKIASDHTLIIDCKLREAFAALNRAEFDDPKGFAEAEKSSSAVQNFFDVRKSLEFFVKNDVCQHQEKDSRLSALRRWISVAEMLVTRYCYEGGFLIIALLQTEPELDLTAELPKVIQERYNKLCNLFSFSGNFKTLRQAILKRGADYALAPVCLLVKDLTAFNQAIEKAAVEMRSCQNGSQLQQKIMIQKELRESKADMLGKIQYNQEQFNRFALPPNLDACYQEAREKYERSLHANPEEREPGVLAEMTAPEPKNLYKDGLLPTFWKRKCTEKTYWNSLFPAPRIGG